MKLTVMLSAAVAVAFSAGLALAGTPFGGDDTGFVPPDKATSKCEDGVAKNSAALSSAVVKCLIKNSDDQFKNAGGGSFDTTTCEVAAAGKYDGKVGALTACPTCLTPIARLNFRDLTVSLTNLNGSVVYCDNTSGTPQDPPTTGFVPPNKDVQKCQNGVAKNASKLIGAIGKCHIKAADSALKLKAFDEEACEGAALGKYDAGNAKLSACPTCLGTAAQAALGTGVVEALVDSLNGVSFCASPSGAFLN